MEHLTLFKSAGLDWPPDIEKQAPLLWENIRHLSRRKQECIFYLTQPFSVDSSETVTDEEGPEFASDVNLSLSWSGENMVKDSLPCIASSSDIWLHHRQT